MKEEALSSRTEEGKPLQKISNFPFPPPYLRTRLTIPNAVHFDTLFRKHETTLRLYARTMVPDWSGVDEVLQTAALVMWKKFDKLENEEGFLPWARVVVRFEAKALCRRLARDRHVFAPELLDILATEQEQLEDEELPSIEEAQSALESCLQKLNEPSRALVLAPYQGHGTVSKLADETGRTRNSLYKQIRRIRAKLEQCVSEEMPTAPKLTF